MVGDARFELTTELEYTQTNTWSFNTLSFNILQKEKVVGDARFELATPWTQTKCATKLR